MRYSVTTFRLRISVNMSQNVETPTGPVMATPTTPMDLKRYRLDKRKKDRTLDLLDTTISKLIDQSASGKLSNFCRAVRRLCNKYDPKDRPYKISAYMVFCRYAREHGVTEVQRMGHLWTTHIKGNPDHKKHFNAVAEEVMKHDVELRADVLKSYVFGSDFDAVAPLVQIAAPTGDP